MGGGVAVAFEEMELRLIEDSKCFFFMKGVT